MSFFLNGLSTIFEKAKTLFQLQLEEMQTINLDISFEEVMESLSHQLPAVIKNLDQEIEKLASKNKTKLIENQLDEMDEKIQDMAFMYSHYPNNQQLNYYCNTLDELTNIQQELFANVKSSTPNNNYHKLYRLCLEYNKLWFECKAMCMDDSNRPIIHCQPGNSLPGETLELFNQLARQIAEANYTEAEQILLNYYKIGRELKAIFKRNNYSFDFATYGLYSWYRDIEYYILELLPSIYYNVNFCNEFNKLI